IATLMGLPGARADELADLRANQQLLEQRINQLAAAQTAAGVPQQQAAVEGGPVVAGAPSLAGSFPRSFLIPGTNTSLAISGYVKYDAEEWFQGGNPSVGSGGSDIYGLAALAAAPLNLKGQPSIFAKVPSVTAAPAFNPAKRQYWVFHNTAAESRLRIETRTPTDLGQVGTVLEMDMQGCTTDGAICSNLNNGTFAELTRLRLAYATIGGFLAGQAFIPVNDNDAHPDLLDFSGDAGQFAFSRAPWIGYTWQLPYGTSFQVAAVTPANIVATPIGGITDGCNPATGLSGISNCPAGSNGGFAINPAKTTMPDANFVFRAEQPWGHVQAGFVLQRLTWQDGALINQNFIGYGGGLSWNWRPNWFGFSSKDNFGFNSFAGDGLGHYANPSGGGEPGTSNGLQTNWGLVGVACNTGTGVGCYGNTLGGAAAVTPQNAALVRTSTIPQRGVEINYQHWWAPNWRSTVSAGWQNNEYNLVLLGRNSNTLNYNRYLTTAHANIIWSPVSFIDTGFEYFFGERQTVLNQRGQINLLDYSFKVKF
ncbi:MAG TPA: DcaP family trimeric outer membrane transporter, partial [Nitrospiria bacterium]|nr:DcaP family trimeric outer membrane transporter [Nitrospiria bacterium]